MPTLSIIVIIPISLIILAGVAGLMIQKKSMLSVRTWVQSVLLGIILTLASLAIHATRMSGTEYFTSFGWPHDIFHAWAAFDGPTPQPTTGWALGPFAIYFLSNVIFFASVVSLCFAVMKKSIHSISRES